MRVGIYSPYLDTAGGGERYMLTIAEILSGSNIVDVFLDTHLQTLDTRQILDKNVKLLDLDLSRVNFIDAPFGKGSSSVKRLVFLRKYDALFYLTDGSIFFPTSKKNILHIQSPIKIPNSGLAGKVKQSGWNIIIYNSKFTKEECQNYWSIPGRVVYPPVNIEEFKNSAKKNPWIISVGRFSGSGSREELNSSKKQEVLIRVFKKLTDSGKARGWSLHLAGGSSEGDARFISELRRGAEGYPVHFYPNLPFEKLKDLYAKSSLYWHAAGFGEQSPDKQEHFGITTVEAMASGCVPVVVNLGGQREIVKEGINGFLWNTEEELEGKTASVIANLQSLKKISSQALASVSRFSKEKFEEEINRIINQ
jgi:glycosyltransferase involved in cell wall biosynthesis